MAPVALCVQVSDTHENAEVIGWLSANIVKTLTREGRVPEDQAK